MGATGEAFSSITNGDTADDSDIYITFSDGVLTAGTTPSVYYTQDDPTDADVEDLLGNKLADEGAAIAFMSTHVGPDQEIWLMDADGTNLVQFTVNTASDNLPDWSPRSIQVPSTSRTLPAMRISGS